MRRMIPDHHASWRTHILRAFLEGAHLGIHDIQPWSTIHLLRAPHDLRGKRIRADAEAVGRYAA